jgi:hypothetical protein
LVGAVNLFTRHPFPLRIAAFPRQWCQGQKERRVTQMSTVEISDIEIGDIKAAFGTTPIGPILQRMLTASEAYEALQHAEIDDDDYDAKAAVLTAEFEAAQADLVNSDEMIPWQASEDGYDFLVILAATPEQALASVHEKIGEYDLSQGTVWVDHTVTSMVHDAEESERIAIDQPEPACIRGHEHDWQSPHSLLGGIEDNPGVWGSGGGVIIKEVCGHCGAYRITDSWAQNPQTGEQGLHSVSYEPADDDSREWVTEEAVLTVCENMDLQVEITADGVSIVLIGEENDVDNRERLRRSLNEALPAAWEATWSVDRPGMRILGPI